MKTNNPHAVSGLLSLVMASCLSAQTPVDPGLDTAVQRRVDKSVKEALEQFAPTSLRPEHLAVTLVDLGDPEQPPAGEAIVAMFRFIRPAS